MDQLNLFNMFQKKNTVDNGNKKIKDLISKRRRQILIHSVLYYRMNTSLIDDYTFDKWAYELADLQKEYPELSNECIFSSFFKDFDGTTGYDLPLNNFWAIGVAKQLIKYNQKKEGLIKWK
ncbi:hypothetical protein [Clostridium cochlearium]|uniref:DNA ligase LigA-related protein n=1 Tax=Clostridium cochlearium TaxID=1494 RepID=UPI00184AD3A8|nr:hypothetical protein [Clostridium cochlearium]NMA58625.1 hypothetical protein [Clostridium cochlearium]